MPDPSAGVPESGWIFASALSLLGMVGGAIAWLVSRGDRSNARRARQESAREAKLDAWHKELSAREERFNAQVATFQARIDRHLAEQDEKITALEGVVEKYRVATAALFARLTHHDPDDPVLKQVGQLLGQAMPFAPGDFDGAMDDLVNRLR